MVRYFFSFLNISSNEQNMISLLSKLVKACEKKGTRKEVFKLKKKLVRFRVNFVTLLRSKVSKVLTRSIILIQDGMVSSSSKKLHNTLVFVYDIS